MPLRERMRTLGDPCFRRLIVAATVFLLVSTASAFCQSNTSTRPLQLAEDDVSASLRTYMALRAQEEGARAILLAGSTFHRHWTPPPPPQSSPAPRNRSIQRKVLGSIVGATAG